jgi:hypothetical protein
MTSKTITSALLPVLAEHSIGSPPSAQGFADPPEELLVPATFTAGRADSADYSIEGEATLTWDADFTAEQEVEWTRAIKKARQKVEPIDDNEMDPHIDVLKQWRNRDKPNTTDAHRDAVLDAIVEILRLELKEE